MQEPGAIRDGIQSESKKQKQKSKPGLDFQPYLTPFYSQIVLYDVRRWATQRQGRGWRLRTLPTSRGTPPSSPEMSVQNCFHHFSIKLINQPLKIVSDYYTELMSRCSDGKMEPEVIMVVITMAVVTIMPLFTFLYLRKFTFYVSTGVQKDLPTCFPRETGGQAGAADDKSGKCGEDRWKDTWATRFNLI